MTGNDDEAPGLPTDLMTLSAACKLLPGSKPGKHLNARTLWRWCRETKEPRSWRIRGRWFVSRGEVLKLARAHVPLDLPSAIVRTEDHREATEYLARRLKTEVR